MFSDDPSNQTGIKNDLEIVRIDSGVVRKAIIYFNKIDGEVQNIVFKDSLDVDILDAGCSNGRKSMLRWQVTI